MSNASLGTILFLFSEAIFFVFLLVAYINFHAGPGKFSMTHNLDVSTAALNTLFLMLSSVMMWRAHRNALRKNFPRFHFWLVATIALGCIFLWGQLREYFRLFQQQITISRDPLSTGFFTVTGFHGLHVFIGVFLLFMLLFWSLVQRRRGHGVPPGSIEAISLYWHFVDGVWIAVFAIVYLWGTQ